MLRDKVTDKSTQEFDLISYNVVKSSTIDPCIAKFRILVYSCKNT